MCCSKFKGCLCATKVINIPLYAVTTCQESPGSKNTTFNRSTNDACGANLSTIIDRNKITFHSFEILKKEKRS